jgi:hypothetical protein
VSTRRPVGGGANVRDHTGLLEYLKGAPDSPLRRLPKNKVGMRVALPRSVRVGRETGNEVEDFGVVPNCLHDMTCNHLLNNNEDLKRHAIDASPCTRSRRRRIHRRQRRTGSASTAASAVKKSNTRSKLLLSMLGPVLINTHQSCWTDGLSSLRPFPNCLQSDACGSPWIRKSQFFRSN